MASRRIVSSDRFILDQGDRDEVTLNTPEKSSVAPAVPTGVIVKLLSFTVAMVIGPIGTYFLSLNTIYSGNATWAGATAAIMANVILIAYVIVAFNDDENDRREGEKRDRKAQ